MSLLTLIASEFIRGLHDSISGVPAVRKIDAQEAARNSNNSTSCSTVQEASPIHQSTLARRRAQQIAQEANINNENVIVITKKRDTIIERLINCCILNGGLCCAALFLFNYIIHPGISSLFIYITGESAFPMWADSLLFVVNSLYFLPLLIISKIINLIWFQDIAEASYRKNRGRPRFLSSGTFIADISFSLFHQFLFILQAKLVCYILSVYCPFTIIVDCILMLHMVPLYSLYAFEYRWFLMGWPVHKRLTYIEVHWAYFLGFGFLLGLLMYFTSNSFFESSFLFALIFPLFIVSANEAKTMPQTIFTVPIFSPISRFADLALQKIIKHSQEIYPIISILFQLASSIFHTLYSLIIQLFTLNKINNTDQLKLLPESLFNNTLNDLPNLNEDLYDNFETELSSFLMNEEPSMNINEKSSDENEDFIDAIDNDAKLIDSKLVELTDKDNRMEEPIDYTKELSILEDDEVSIVKDVDSNELVIKSDFNKQQWPHSYLIYATTLTLLFLAVAIWLAILEDAEEAHHEMSSQKALANVETVQVEQELRSELLQPGAESVRNLYHDVDKASVDTTEWLNYSIDDGNENIDHEPNSILRPMDTKIKKSLVDKADHEKFIYQDVPVENSLSDDHFDEKVLNDFIEKQFAEINQQQADHLDILINDTNRNKLENDEIINISSISDESLKEELNLEQLKNIIDLKLSSHVDTLDNDQSKRVNEDDKEDLNKDYLINNTTILDQNSLAFDIYYQQENISDTLIDILDNLPIDKSINSEKAEINVGNFDNIIDNEKSIKTEILNDTLDENAIKNYIETEILRKETNFQSVNDLINFEDYIINSGSDTNDSNDLMGFDDLNLPLQFSKDFHSLSNEQSIKNNNILLDESNYGNDIFSSELTEDVSKKESNLDKISTISTENNLYIHDLNLDNLQTFMSTKKDNQINQEFTNIQSGSDIYTDLSKFTSNDYEKKDIAEEVKNVKSKEVLKVSTEPPELFDDFLIPDKIEIKSSLDTELKTIANINIKPIVDESFSDSCKNIESSDTRKFFDQKESLNEDFIKNEELMVNNEKQKSVDLEDSITLITNKNLALSKSSPTVSYADKSKLNYKQIFLSPLKVKSNKLLSVTSRLNTQDITSNIVHKNVNTKTESDILPNKDDEWPILTRAHDQPSASNVESSKTDNKFITSDIVDSPFFSNESLSNETFHAEKQLELDSSGLSLRHNVEEEDKDMFMKVISTDIEDVDVQKDNNDSQQSGAIDFDDSADKELM